MATKHRLNPPTITSSYTNTFDNTINTFTQSTSQSGVYNTYRVNVNTSELSTTQLMDLYNHDYFQKYITNNPLSTAQPQPDYYYGYPGNTTNLPLNYYGYQGNTTANIPFNKFLCYPSTEGRIREAKKEIIFKLLSNTKMEYNEITKHLNLPIILFNTILLEYAIIYATKRYMQLMSTNSFFSQYDLYREVVKIY